MVADLTQVSLKTLNNHLRIDSYFLFSTMEKEEDEESFYLNAYRGLVLTGDKEQRRQKRKFRFAQAYHCQSCGKFYINRPWHDTEGICPKCVKKEKPHQFLPRSADRTQRIRDLWNRCY